MKANLERAAQASEVVRVARNRLRGAASIGVPLAVSPELILLRPEENFHLDGYEVIRLADVDQVVRGETELLTERILLGEGELPLQPPSSVPPIASWTELFAWLSSDRVLVMLECEESEPSTLFLGTVVAVASGAVALRCLDRDGTWDEEPQLFRLAEVTRLRFGDRYSVMYGKYASAAT